MPKSDFRKLKRVNLIEIIYQLQRNEKALKEQNALLTQKIEELEQSIIHSERPPAADNNVQPFLNETYEKVRKATEAFVADIERLREQSEQEFQKLDAISKKMTAAMCEVSKAVTVNKDETAAAEAEKDVHKSGQPPLQNPDQTPED